MNGLGKTSSKNQFKIFLKKTENLCHKAACEQKTASENFSSNEKTKTRPRMNYEWIAKIIQKKNP